MYENLMSKKERDNIQSPEMELELKNGLQGTERRDMKASKES
jgi:hypothetical protein